jgi:dihydroneopterin aldolase
MPEASHSDPADLREERIRHVFVRDLVMHCSIGVHAHEHEALQRVRLNLELRVPEGDGPLGDDLRNVVCYDEIITAVRRIVDAGHVRLIETLAERIAELCLADHRVRSVRVQLEKLDVYKDVGAVGIAIERQNVTKIVSNAPDSRTAAANRAEHLYTSPSAPVKRP